jgi:hypothetical protein
MTAELKVIGKPTVQQEFKDRLLEVAKHLVEDIESEGICGMVCIAVRPDRSFALYQSGDINRIETLGLLETAKHDLLHEEHNPHVPVNDTPNDKK